MGEPVVIVLEGTPQAWQRPQLVSRGGKPRPFTSQDTRKYMESLGWAARAVMGARPLLIGPLVVSIVVSLPIPESWTKAERELARIGDIIPTVTPDLDNFCKIVFDSLSCIVYPDDKQIVFLTASKVYSTTPSLRVEIATMKREGAAVESI